MHPTLIEFGFFRVYTYGFFVAVAMTVTFCMIAFLAPRFGFSKMALYDLVLVIFVTGVIGARVAYVIQNADLYRQNPTQAFWLGEGGLVWYGGAILAAFSALLYGRAKKMPLLRTADFFAPLIALGHSIGRIGCFFNGCCYGLETKSSLGVHFNGNTVNRLPTQLFESLYLFILFWVLLYILFKKYREGTVFLSYLFLYGVWRFIIEFVRDNQAKFGILTIAQWVSVVWVLGSLILLFLLPARHAKR